MISKLNILATSAAVWLLASGAALAEPCGASPLPACSVPEPSSLPLIIVAAVAVGVAARLFKKK
jgi:hypothetical protein